MASSQSSSQSSFAGIQDADYQAALKSLIQLLQGGGSAEFKASQASRREQTGATQHLLGQYDKNLAFLDAEAMMAQNLRQSLEKNMPAIAKAVQGAGTSASSMQGLLSTKLATESAQAAGALGAEQAKAYGGIQAQLSSVLEALTRPDNMNEQALIKALDLGRIQTSSSVSSGSSSDSGGGGGSSGGSSRGVSSLGGGSSAGGFRPIGSSSGGYISSAGGGDGGSIFWEPSSYIPMWGESDQESWLNSFGNDVSSYYNDDWDAYSQPNYQPDTSTTYWGSQEAQDAAYDIYPDYSDWNSEWAW